MSNFDKNIKCVDEGGGGVINIVVKAYLISNLYAFFFNLNVFFLFFLSKNKIFLSSFLFCLFIYILTF